MIIATKLNRQSWGPKKVLDYLREKSPALQWPADSRQVRSSSVRGWSSPYAPPPSVAV